LTLAAFVIIGLLIFVVTACRQPYASKVFISPDHRFSVKLNEKYSGQEHLISVNSLVFLSVSKSDGSIVTNWPFIKMNDSVKGFFLHYSYQKWKTNRLFWIGTSPDLPEAESDKCFIVNKTTDVIDMLNVQVGGSTPKEEWLLFDLSPEEKFTLYLSPQSNSQVEDSYLGIRAWFKRKDLMSEGVTFLNEFEYKGKTSYCVKILSNQISITSNVFEGEKFDPEELNKIKREYNGMPPFTPKKIRVSVVRSCSVE
jgi:hypothetical protein